MPILIASIKLPSDKSILWEDFLIRKIKGLDHYQLELDCCDWILNCEDLAKLKNLLAQSGIKLKKLKSTKPETIVSAKALFLNCEIYIKNPEKVFSKEDSHNIKSISTKVTFHEGTIRAGEQIHSEGNLFIFGDVNPGSIVSANGDVMIWGKLLGIAHAGKAGNSNAKISALHLRPLQLRIAATVARGPKEKQEDGFAEQAEIQSGTISIKPLTCYK